MREDRRSIAFSGVSGWMLLFPRESVKQVLFGLFLLFLGPSVGVLFGGRFPAGSDGGNYVADLWIRTARGPRGKAHR